MNTKIEQWSAHARTPETRTRIRRLAVLERILHVLGVLGVCAFVVMLAISWYITTSGESPWWIWFLDIGVLLASIFPYFVTLARLETAMYADGEESVGTITSVVIDPRNVSDSETSYDTRLRRNTLKVATFVVSRACPRNRDAGTGSASATTPENPMISTTSCTSDSRTTIRRLAPDDQP